MLLLLRSYLLPRLLLLLVGTGVCATMHAAQLWLPLDISPPLISRNTKVVESIQPMIIPAGTDSDSTTTYLLYYKKGGHVDLSDLQLQPTTTTYQPPEGSTYTDIYLQMAWLNIPASVCPNRPTREGFEYANELCPPQVWKEGVGFGQALYNTWFTCCSTEAIRLNICPDSRPNELLVPPETPLYSLPVGTTEPTWLQSPPDGFLTAPVDGYYALILANCHANTDTVVVSGQVHFITNPHQVDEGSSNTNTNNNTSLDYYGSGLPSGMLVVPLHLLGILSYLTLLGWFSNRMKGGEYHYTIEEWIGRTIAIGLCAVVLRCLEYLLYDHTGDRHPFVALVSAFGYAAKHGLTRALLVGLATGVGALPSRLKFGSLVYLVVLTIVYVAVVTGLDYWAFVQERQVDNERPVRTILVGTKAVLEILFWCWMWKALCRTISDLRAMNRPSSAIFRYRALFWILIVLAAVSGAVFVAVVTEKTDYGSIGLFDNRGLSQLDEVCVFFMLLAAAILWRPRQFLAETPDDLEMMQGITESHPDIPEDSPLVKEDYDLS